MINEYQNAIRDHIQRLINQNMVAQLIIWDVQSDEAKDPTLLCRRVYGSQLHVDVIKIACGISGFWEKLPEQRIALPTLNDILRMRREYLEN